MIVHPFAVDIGQRDVDDLRFRLAAIRWPDQPSGTGWSRGVPLEYMRDLAGYWSDGFDWRKQEAVLNEVSQFVATIDGQDIHFLHVRSPEPDAQPLILTHGWPSSNVEFLKVIGPLADPRAYGADPADAFHLVIPSLPGYGFSTPLQDPGWGNLMRVAQAWAQLMAHLGYERYGVHGTDAGGGVAGMLAALEPQRVAGVHLTGTMAAMPFGPRLELDGLSALDRARGERFHQFQADGMGYLHMQTTRPQTLAYSLADSPVGQLAWIVEKFQEWTDPAADLPEHAVDRDHLLTNVSIFWFTGSGASSAHAVYEGMKAFRHMAAQQGSVHTRQRAAPPMGVAVFAADTTIRTVMDPNQEFQHWTEFGHGGHFPAMEVPDLLMQDLRAFFGKHR